MTSLTNPSVLFLPEEESLGLVVTEALQQSGFDVKQATSVRLTEVRRELEAGEYEMVLVYADRDNQHSLIMLQELREICDVICLVVLKGAKKEEMLEAYRLGADDVLTAPISTEIIACKMKAFSRRLRYMEGAATQTEYAIGSLTFHSDKQVLMKGNQVLHKLSGRESELLEVLVKNEMKLVDRGYILRRIWKSDDYFCSRSLSVYINHLRHMLEADSRIKILSIHGKGYKLCIE